MEVRCHHRSEEGIDRPDRCHFELRQQMFGVARLPQARVDECFGFIPTRARPQPRQHPPNPVFELGGGLPCERDRHHLSGQQTRPFGGGGAFSGRCSQRSKRSIDGFLPTAEQEHRTLVRTEHVLQVPMGHDERLAGPSARIEQDVPIEVQPETLASIQPQLASPPSRGQPSLTEHVLLHAR